MALSKIQAESMNLADTYAFTGSVSGAGGGIFESQLLHAQHQTTGTSGSSISGTQTRVLNTVLTNEITGASLSSNQITLPSGTYFVCANAGSWKGTGHKINFRNVTDSTVMVIGTSQYTTHGDSVSTSSFLFGRFTLSAQKVCDLRHYIGTAQGTQGLGIQANDGNNNVFADVQIWKVA